MIARDKTGIRVRLWMAVLMSVAALLVNIFYIDPAYDSLPSIVPITFTPEGDIATWGHRSIIDDYDDIRVAFFLVMSLIGWGICRYKKNSLLGKRIMLLVIDIANLVITTGVGMTLVYIEIANGVSDEKLSEEWEYSVMLFWLLILVIEYITDKKHLKEPIESV